MAERASQAQETFLVAVDKKTDKIAGFLNGIATDEDVPLSFNLAAVLPRRGTYCVNSGTEGVDTSYT